MQREDFKSNKSSKYRQKQQKGSKARNNGKSSLIIIDQSSEEEVPLDIFENGSNIRSRLFCCPFVLIAPPDTIFYSKIQNRLSELTKSNSRQSVLKFIQSNLQFHYIDNIYNLKAFQQDEQLWLQTIPQLLSLLYRRIDIISGQIRLLVKNENEVIDLSRQQVLVMLASMFFGIMPKQYHQNLVSFGQLMQQSNNQKDKFNNPVKLQKLRCIISYFKTMVKQERIFNQKIQIRRAFSTNSHLLQNKQNFKLRKVEIKQLKFSGIQSYYCQGIMLDFAHKRIGGGILKNGSLQEEIMFSIFPQLIVTKLLCFQLEDTEAIVVHGARRFSYFDGYEQSFCFLGECFTELSHYDYQKSVIVAVDAYNFNPKIYVNNLMDQYSKKGLKRELIKAVTGFKGAAIYADFSMPICTGGWGCGAFKGDEDVKFIIQWVCCSISGRDMIYFAGSEKKAIQYKCLVRQFTKQDTNYMLQLLDSYFSFRKKVKRPNMPSLLQFIKNDIL